MTKMYGNLLTFIEDPNYGYRERTYKNASADVTIAIASDFYTAGERLTKKAVLEQGKTYIPIDISQRMPIDSALIDSIVDLLNKANCTILNIAGNGIYTVKGRYTQEELDAYLYELLSKVFSSTALKKIPSLIRSGGQTGIDESGVKAGVRLGIPSLVYAPRGWKFRDITGADLSDYKLFTKRFENLL